MDNETVIERARSTFPLSMRYSYRASRSVANMEIVKQREKQCWSLIGGMGGGRGEGNKNQHAILLLILLFLLPHRFHHLSRQLLPSASYRPSKQSRSTNRNRESGRGRREKKRRVVRVACFAIRG